MTCKDLADFLLDYLNGELGGVENREFEKHLARCEDCRNYIDSYRQTVTLVEEMRALQDEEAQDHVPQELVEAILAARKR